MALRLICLGTVIFLINLAQANPADLWEEGQAAAEKADWATALNHLQELAVDGGTLPPAFSYRYGQALIGTKEFDRGRQQLLHYLQQAGRQGEHYASAIQLCVDARHEQLAEAERQAYEAELAKLRKWRVPEANYAPLLGLHEGSREAQELQKKWVEELELPLEIRTGEVGIVFRLVPPGSALVGCPPEHPDSRFYNTQHHATFTRPI